MEMTVNYETYHLITLKVTARKKPIEENPMKVIINCIKHIDVTDDNVLMEV